MRRVCPSCKFVSDVEPTVRLELCPKCQAEGREVYLIDAPRPKRARRTDLIGLLATARGELARRRGVGQ